MYPYSIHSIQFDINSFNKTFIASYSHVYIELQVQWNSELNIKKKRILNPSRLIEFIIYFFVAIIYAYFTWVLNLQYDEVQTFKSILYRELFCRSFLPKFSFFFLQSFQHTQKPRFQKN